MLCRAAAVLTLAVVALAQDPAGLEPLRVPAPAGAEVVVPGAGLLQPRELAADRMAPLAIVCIPADFPAADQSAVAQQLAARGFIALLAAGDLPNGTTTALRQRFRIAGGGMHLVGLAAATAQAVDLARAEPWEFASVSLFGGVEPPADLRQRFTTRRLVWFADGPAPATLPAPAAPVEQRPAVSLGEHPAVVARHLETLVADRDPGGIAGELSGLLDAFHDAAAKGDEERYFTLLPDDAVFLGTDATERWTGEQFREFAMPYFTRGPAWTYVPCERHVTMGPNGALAWFDELLDNEAYGLCRGSGVLQLREGQWVVRQYNLSIPVPNELARGVVARIRDFALGLPAATATYVVVRHAEKGDGTDPELTEVGQARALRLAAALADLPIAAVFTSEFRRTQMTAAPVCAARQLQPTVVPAADGKGLLAALRAQPPRTATLVVAHSNTVAPVLRGLGVTERVQVGEADFDRLFVVTVTPAGPTLVQLRY